MIFLTSTKKAIQLGVIGLAFQNFAGAMDNQQFKNPEFSCCNCNGNGLSQVHPSQNEWENKISEFFVSSDLESNYIIKAQSYENEYLSPKNFVAGLIPIAFTAVGFVIDFAATQANPHVPGGIFSALGGAVIGGMFGLAIYFSPLDDISKSELKKSLLNDINNDLYNKKYLLQGSTIFDNTTMSQYGYKEAKIFVNKIMNEYKKPKTE